MCHLIRNRIACCGHVEKSETEAYQIDKKIKSWPESGLEGKSPNFFDQTVPKVQPTSDMSELEKE